MKSAILSSHSHFVKDDKSFKAFDTIRTDPPTLKKRNETVTRAKFKEKL